MGAQLQLIGIGLTPAHLTVEAINTLKDVEAVLILRKSAEDDLADYRIRIAKTYAPQAAIIELTDPPRERSVEKVSEHAGYTTAVQQWHRARVELLAQTISGFETKTLGKESNTFALLVWGDPAFYDSAIRLATQLKGEIPTMSVRVIPGISSVQYLAAAHQIVLHEVGASFLVTTARRLSEAIATGVTTIAVMLTSGIHLEGLGDWEIYWGANLGDLSEKLIAGKVSAVAESLELNRNAAKAEAGWVMDIFILRRPS